MSVPAVDGSRLQKLLGGVDLATLRLRLRARYERGPSRDEFTLTDLAAHERRALADLLGRPTLVAGSMRARCSELDAALARAGIASTLREALEFLDGPLVDRRADRAAREQAWRTTLSSANESRLAALLATTSGVALVKRLSGSDAKRATLLLSQAERVLARLPGHGTSRAQLSAEVLGDSHGLDNGRPVATLVLRASAVDAPIDAIDAIDPASLQDPEESSRERWARLGITVNELALPALCLNLPGLESRRVSPGEPLHLSLRGLLRRPPAWQVSQRDVFVCENPNIVAIAADRLGMTCAPLVCTDGMPSAAQQTLLAQLSASGAALHYHGDFDWPGLVIGNFIMRKFGAKPWRFGAAEYLSSVADHPIALRDDKPVVAHWDHRLAIAMSQRRVVVHEESVVETLLRDLAANGAAFGE